MNIKTVLIAAGIVLASNSLYAQYTADALRFSQPEQGSTARFKGMGNAQTALGGDISSLSSNPAGLGFFTKSEFSFTPEFNNFKVGSSYLNTNADASQSKAGINQIGAVFYSPTKRLKGSDVNSGWVSLNFGIGYNKTNNFNSKINYGGTNPNSSIADYFADQSTLNYGTKTGPNGSADFFDAGSLEQMAYKNFLTEYNAGGYFPTTQLNNLQNFSVINTGSQSEVNLGVAGNYSNKLYFGASLGFANIDFTSDKLYSESGLTKTFPGQQADFLNGSYNLAYRSFQDTKGSGFNAKVGLIYKPVDALRLGLSFISPTWYSLTDRYSEGLNTGYSKQDGTVIPEYKNADQSYDQNYNLRTPYRVNGGVSYIVANAAILTADVEYVDYSSIKFTAGGGELERNTNRAISDSYKGNLNYRVGAEVKVASQFMLRGGYNYASSPYKNIDVNTQAVSGGVGFRFDNYYLDATYRHSMYNSTNSPYVISSGYADFATTGSGSTADLKNTADNVYLTLGVRF
ncbi:long-subunit fatty acid transport protein [Pedobacter sp. UYEF25]